MENIKFLICGDVKAPQRKFGDAGIDVFCPNRTEQFIEDVKNCNVDKSIIITDGDDVASSAQITIARNSIVIKPGCDIKFPLYIRSLIEPNTVLMVTNKSGVSTKQKFICGANTIDASYEGIHHAHLINFSNDAQKIEFGQKIIQEVPTLIDPSLPVVEDGVSVEEFYKDHNHDRGDGGFGSTGIK